MGIELIQPGDFICVSYLQPNLVEEGIAEFEAGKLKGIFEHAAGCIGGPEIVQALTSGVKYGSVNDYLTPGYAKVLFCRIPMTPAQREGCVNYWKSQVGDSYNFQGDARLGLLLGMRALHLNWLARLLRPIVPVGDGKFCSQLVVNGVNSCTNPKIFNLGAANYSPQDLAVSPIPQHYQLWDGSKFVTEGI